MASVVVIALGRRNPPILLGLLLLGAVLTSVYLISHKPEPIGKTILLDGARFSTEVANTPKTREQGLSGRTGLGQNKAMLFVFDTGDTECFWMPDMNFALDMVWLDDQQKVTAIEHSVTPASYPKNFCHTGKYVIEVNAGVANRLNLKIGDQANL